ncbi:MAG: glutamate--cysteine ligase [Gammaproteobacteria bacterium]|nr:glutamate--cysteine ligase [Gammaproteobacteria bacterium]MYF02440.1 glutamate--cysteine ligase [Gammaproteobacteria bacterium]MYI76845.1 glutamate--cysteine ligase [Gammaproteobacteria bacterium]
MLEQKFSQLLAGLRGHPGLGQLNHGLEKEALRIDRHGYLSKKPHPNALGSSLTHPSITTDFSEAQLELVTSVHSSIESCMQEMEEIHRFVYEVLDSELLWPSSMPCMLRGEKSIPLADYGSSNLGKFKRVYRQGLALRYGKYMQTISGMHYNFSLPNSLWAHYAKLRGVEDSIEFRNQSYLGLIRNFRRYAWLLVYLFGTSPAVCGSFLAGRAHELEPFDGESYYLPYATSLRMGPLGYQSTEQGRHYLSYNTLADYRKSMLPLLSKPHPQYEELGLHSSNGEYQQLSLSLLQTEAESYTPIRPKPKAKCSLRPLLALEKQGIEYLEVRCLDLNPFFSTGIDRTTLYFLDAFLLLSLITPSPRDSQEHWEEDQRSQSMVVERGRDPNLEIIVDGKFRSLHHSGRTVLDLVEQVARLLDEIDGGSKHKDAVVLQKEKLQNPSKTPSALLLQQMATWEKSYYRTIETLSKQHRDDLQKQPLSESRRQHYHELATQSHRDQRELEVSDTRPFEHYLEDFMQLELSE